MGNLQAFQSPIEVKSERIMSKVQSEQITGGNHPEFFIQASKKMRNNRR